MPTYNMPKSNETLEEMLRNLTTKVEEGFDGVHKRQDYTNGKVSANTEHRIKMESALSVYKGLFGLLSGGVLTGILKIFDII